jgi:hypothetical protein
MEVRKYLDSYKARFQPAFLSSCDRSLVSSLLSITPPRASRPTRSTKPSNIFYNSLLSSLFLKVKHWKMAIILSFVTFFLILQAAWSWARPTDALKSRSGSGICGLPSSSGVTCTNGVAKYTTSSGQTISGQINSQGVIRVSVKYATAQRFQPPQIAATIPTYVLYSISTTERR